MQGSPSWDLFIGLFLIIGVTYGFMLQREKVVVTMVSTYAALVASQILTPLVQQFFSGEKTVLNSFISANPSSFAIQSAIFGVIVVALTIKSGIAGMRVRGFMSPIESGIYSVLSIILILSSLISFMPDDQRIKLLDSSKIAKFIFIYHQWWIILPIVALVVFGRQHVFKEPE